MVMKKIPSGVQMLDKTLNEIKNAEKKAEEIINDAHKKAESIIINTKEENSKIIENAKQKSYFHRKKTKLE